MFTPKFYLISFLFLIFYSSLHAQDTTKPFRNEVAINISPVFAGIMFSNSLPSFTYRRHYTKGALRVRLSFSGNDNKTTNTSTSLNINVPDRTTKNTELALRVGYQWHKDYNRLRWYYGIDAFAIYGENSDLYSNISTDNQGMVTYINTINSKNNYTGIGISPIVGLSCQISSRFSVSIESALTLSKTFGKADQASKTIQEPSSPSPTVSEYNLSNKTTGTNYSFIPMNGLLVSYHF